MKRVLQFSQKKSAWMILGGSALLLETIALYFQYSMGLEPCIMCIYQRTAILGVFFAGAIGFIAPTNRMFRGCGFVLWGTSSIWGLLIAKEHIDMQTTTDPFAFTCDVVPNFPSFLPLHDLLPAFFAATGDCGSIDWVFLNMSMPQWMEIIFTIYSSFFILFALTSLINKR